MRDMFTSSLSSSPSTTSSPPSSLLRPSSTSSAPPSPSSDLLTLCRRVVSAQRLDSTGLRGASAALLAQFRRLYTGQKEYSDDCVIDIMRAMAPHEHNRVVRSTASADSAPIDLTAEQDGDDVANSHHDGRLREEKHGSVDDETEDEDEQKVGPPSLSSSAARQPSANICNSGLSSRRRLSSLTLGWEEEVADRAASLVLLKQEEAVRQEKAASVRLWRERGRSCRSFGRRVAVLWCWSLAALVLLAVLAVVGCWVAPWMMEMREQLVDHAGEGGLWGWMTRAEVLSPQCEGTGMLEQA